MVALSRDNHQNSSIKSTMSRTNTRLIIFVGLIISIALGYVLFSCTQDRNFYESEAKSMKIRVRECVKKSVKCNKQLTACDAKASELGEANADVQHEFKLLEKKLKTAQKADNDKKSKDGRVPCFLPRTQGNSASKITESSQRG